jgi:hypothetical protein
VRLVDRLTIHAKQGIPNTTYLPFQAKVMKINKQMLLIPLVVF